MLLLRLPSFTEAYTQSTPLTRIRDIAHRNDIPHDLKQEIKHTIQVGHCKQAASYLLQTTSNIDRHVEADQSFG